jgi:DEAD/DEAH box helicase domain-containing protein
MPPPPDPTDPPSFADLVASWAEAEHLDGELVHARIVPARSATFGDLTEPIAPVLAARLAERGVERLYRHQARAVTAIRSGDHTVLVSGTASGKTLCYQIPIVERILDDPKATALLMFPTKALAQDQLRSFRSLNMPGVTASTYDGDTPGEDRVSVRRHSNVVFTNPDMLHFGILPNHGKWAEFFLRLRYVVVDEMHTLRGMFGSHTAHILRRLRRVAAHYGAHPTFVFASATIGNPGELAAALSGLQVGVVEGDDSPVGARVVALWNPRLEDPEAGTRRSSIQESTDLFVELVRAGRHTIVFSRGRKSTELIYRWASERLPPELAARIAPYRAGYSPTDRRATEQRLFNGELLGVTATSALELGIDVGSLDAAIINTFPGTLASFRQQAGRAGRTKEDALVALVGGQDALDQYFMHHPDEMFSRPPEAAVINPHNPTVLDAHVACAAYELPLVPDDAEYFGEGTEEAANRLAQDEHLRIRDGRLFWARRRSPAPQINLRSSGGPTYTIADGKGELLGTVEQERAFRDTHPGAVYLHQGATYVVQDLDLARHEIAVTEQRVDYYTQPKEEKFLEILDVEAKGPLGLFTHWLGRVRVESQVVGYRKKRLGASAPSDALGLEYLDLPATTFDTQAFWFTCGDEVLSRARVDARDVPGTLHAAEHTMIAMLPLYAICDRWDIGGLSTPFQPQTGTNTIFIYDGYHGGAGIAPVAYAFGQDHVRATLTALLDCPCESGCPSCVQSPKCGNFNDPLSKHGAIALLRTALG